MHISDLTNEFEHSGYNYISVNVQGVNIYYTVVNECLYIVSILHLLEGYEFTKEQYANIIRQIKQSFDNKGYRLVRFLSVICTNYPNIAKELYIEEDPQWIVDLFNNRLIIYENQPGQYLDVKEIIESVVTKYREETSNISDTPIKNRIRQVSLINSVIIVLNVLVFLLIEIIGTTTNADLMVRFGAMYWPYMIGRSQYYRLFSHMFLHFGIQHLFNNMLVLAFIGDNLERLVGKVRFLVIYLLSGVLAGIASMVYNMVQGKIVVSAGASGAVFGVVGAMVYIVSVNRGRVEDISTKQLVIFAFIGLYSGFVSQGVDNIAHIGGLLSGIILAIILYRKH